MDFIQEILQIIRSNLPDQQIKEKLLEYHDSDIADVLDYLDEDERLRIAKILGVEEVSDVLTYMEDADELLEQISDEKVADIIENLDADDAVDLLQEMEEEDQEKILELIEDEEVREDIELILSFEEDEIGSLMTTNYINILESDSVQSAMKKLIEQASENDNISTILVTKENGEFIGAIPLQDLIIARKNEKLEDKIMYNYPSITGKSKIDESINSIKEYYEDIIPVVDDKNVLIGVLTANDLVELVTEEATEDYHRLAGLTEEEEVDESIFQSIKKRIPWLSLLLVLGLIVTSVISAFENVINAVTGAVVFQSLVFGMAGNGGTQALAVTLTSINSEDELSKKKVWKMFFKELRVGFLNGLLLGILSFVVIFGFMAISKQNVIVGTPYNIQDALLVAACVSGSLLLSVTFSSLIGLLFPLFFKKIKIDPAVASGPMITTLNDILSACIYYVLVGICFGCF
ncbi:MAG: magnesium transporter [Erysipelotrichaceae bacterium]|nr:magnesium transporter [Erysipelotrichaceae bacterium]